ncbi:MAG: hypothetical protein JNL70_18960 [Saprospiraceae bacterium]|nr:hypothetical protein [Saprospiraceae bacterium]
MTKAVLEALFGKLETILPTHDLDVYVEQAYNSEDVPLWSTPALLVQFAPVNWRREAATSRLVTDGPATVTIWHVNETGYDNKKRWLNTPHLDGDAALQRGFSEWEALSAYSFQGQQLPLIESVEVVGSSWEQVTSNLIISKTVLSCIYYNYETARNVVAVTDFDIRTQFNITNSKNDTDESEAINITLEQ